MKIYLVGGAVRDELLGRKPHDQDYVVVGATVGEFTERFPGAVLVGKDFPVFIFDGEEYAFARRERKVGIGHKGFAVEFSPEVTLKEDLYRRDLTINAMAKDIKTGEIIDPFGGQEDLKNGILRIVSDAFAEDPLRVFRVARFAAELGFSVAEETMLTMRSMQSELVHLPGERVFAEFKKALNSPNPQKFFRVLRYTECLEYWFKPVFDLIGVEQPQKWHPEGDAYEHTMITVSKSTGDIQRFAALCHDFGKAVTPRELWPKHHGHDKAADPIILEFCKKIKAPKEWRKTARMVARLHMRAKKVTRPKKILEVVLDAGTRFLYLVNMIHADAMMPENEERAVDAISRILSARDVIISIGGEEVHARWAVLSQGEEFGERLMQLRIEALKARLQNKS